MTSHRSANIPRLAGGHSSRAHVGPPPPQHHQRICLTTQRRAQDLPVKGSIASAQSQVTQCLPPTGMFVGRRLFAGHIFEVAVHTVGRLCLVLHTPS